MRNHVAQPCLPVHVTAATLEGHFALPRQPADSPVSKFRSPAQNPEQHRELTTTSDSHEENIPRVSHGKIVTFEANFRAQLCTALHIARPCDRICMEKTRQLEKRNLNKAL